MKDQTETKRRRFTLSSFLEPKRVPAFACIACCLLPMHAGALFSKVQGIEAARIRSVVVSQSNPAFMAVASDNTVFLSADGGDSFQKTAVLKDETINHLFIGPNGDATVFVAGTRNGYRIRQNVERIFSADEGETLHDLGVHKGRIYAATSDGLYLADENLLNWQTVPGLKNSAVYSVEGFGDNLYAACDSGVYLYRPDGTLLRLFIARGNGENVGMTPRQVLVDPLTPNRLWLATNQGMFSSSDAGATWKKFYAGGVGNMVVNCLAQFPLDGNSLYACSESGLFKIDIASGTAEARFEGLPTSKIKWADFTDSGEMYLATDQGLFKSEPASPTPPPIRGGMTDLIKGEPSIHEVQQAALRYNSVHPDKTGSWRKRIKYRALFPKVSLDYDKTIGSSFTSSGHYYATGPNDWGVTFTWDVGDLIWNSYEDDIDNRTKLTTQLRMDILDEVNRLYYERLRLKHEIATTNPAMEDITMKQLRFDELTATLDGYTGGLFSR